MSLINKNEFLRMMSSQKQAIRTKAEYESRNKSIRNIYGPSNTTQRILADKSNMSSMADYFEPAHDYLQNNRKSGNMIDIGSVPGCFSLTNDKKYGKVNLDNEEINEQSLFWADVESPTMTGVYLAVLMSKLSKSTDDNRNDNFRNNNTKKGYCYLKMMYLVLVHMLSEDTRSDLEYYPCEDLNDIMEDLKTTLNLSDDGRLRESKLGNYWCQSVKALQLFCVYFISQISGVGPANKLGLTKGKARVLKGILSSCFDFQVQNEGDLIGNTSILTMSKCLQDTLSGNFQVWSKMYLRFLAKPYHYTDELSPLGTRIGMYNMQAHDICLLLGSLHISREGGHGEREISTLIRVLSSLARIMNDPFSAMYAGVINGRTGVFISNYESAELLAGCQLMKSIFTGKIEDFDSDTNYPSVNDIFNSLKDKAISENIWTEGENEHTKGIRHKFPENNPILGRNYYVYQSSYVILFWIAARNVGSIRQELSVEMYCRNAAESSADIFRKIIPSYTRYMDHFGKREYKACISIVKEVMKYKTILNLDELKIDSMFGQMKKMDDFEYLKSDIEELEKITPYSVKEALDVNFVKVRDQDRGTTHLFAFIIISRHLPGSGAIRQFICEQQKFDVVKSAVLDFCKNSAELR